MPALYRYFLLSASRKQDCFQDEPTMENLREGGLPWMLEVFGSLGLSEEQVVGIHSMGDKLRGKQDQTQCLISRLQRVKEEMKSQSVEFDRMVDMIRADIGPVLSAHLVIFGERNKLRPECSLEHCLG